MIYMMAVLLGINLMAVGAVLMYFIMNRQTTKPPPQPVAEPVVLDPKTMEELERRKKKLVAEQEAFQVLMSYNADVAYGGGDEV